jgi:hypothetical protein
MEPAKREPLLGRIVNWYKAAAIMLLNTVVLFVIINVVLWVAIVCKAWLFENPNIPMEFKKYGSSAMSSLRITNPSMTDQQRLQLLNESYTRRLRFDQFVDGKEPPYHGTFVNISEHNYRITPPQGPWPIDPSNYNIFVFGGSTTFGYGVTDEQTIPFYLQELLSESKFTARRVAVYNFGFASCYSTPERILFQQLLQNGAKPDLVVFIDGLNDFYWADDGIWALVPQLKEAAEPRSNMRQLANYVVGIYRLTPLARAVVSVGEKFGIRDHAIDTSALVPTVIPRYLFNKRADELMAGEYNIPAVFVFQPVPTYNFDVHYHLFMADDLYVMWGNDVIGYPLMADYVNHHDMGKDFLWLADMQKGIQKPIYCDQVHYTAEFSKQIADQILEFINTRHLLH